MVSHLDLIESLVVAIKELVGPGSNVVVHRLNKLMGRSGTLETDAIPLLKNWNF